MMSHSYLAGSKHVDGYEDGGVGPCVNISSHELHSCTMWN